VKYRALLAITGAFSISGGIALVNRLIINTLIDENFQLTIYSLVENPDNQGLYKKDKIKIFRS